MYRFIWVVLLALSAVSSFALEHSKDYFNNIAASVRIVTDNGASGSGLAIDKRHVLTAGHVCNGEDGVRVDFVDPDGKVVSVRGKVLKFEESDTAPFDNDLGLIKLNDDAPAFVKAKLGKDVVGEEGYTIGAPRGLMPRNIMVGIFGGRHEHIDVRALSGANQPGSSGSAVFNDKHEIVGVLVSGESALLIYFIPVGDIEEFLKDVKFKKGK